MATASGVFDVTHDCNGRDDPDIDRLANSVLDVDGICSGGVRKAAGGEEKSDFPESRGIRPLLGDKKLSCEVTGLERWATGILVTVSWLCHDGRRVLGPATEDPFVNDFTDVISSDSAASDRSSSVKTSLLLSEEL